MTHGISLISTYAEDVLLRSDGGIITRQKGGPLLFIEAVVKRKNIPHNLLLGEQAVVEVQIDDSGIERSKIKEIPTQPIHIDTLLDWVLISTLLHEWDIANLTQYKGRIFIDIQGYVRNGTNFGGKKLWEGVASCARPIDCLKGTYEEVQYLPKDVFEDQKSRLLIITDGSNKITLYHNNKKFELQPKAVVKPKDTLGAGDTFFANFVSALYLGSSPQKALETAANATTIFLEKK